MLSDISNDKYPHLPLRGLIERELYSISITFVNSMNNNPCPFLHFWLCASNHHKPPQHLFGQEELSCTALIGKADMLEQNLVRVGGKGSFFEEISLSSGMTDKILTL